MKEGLQDRQITGSKALAVIQANRWYLGGMKHDIRKQDGKDHSCHMEKPVIPIEAALMAFMRIKIPEAEIEKGIPFVSFVAKKGKGAVFIKPFPLPVADRYLEEQEEAGNEVLYRVDYLRGGAKNFTMGVLSVGNEPETFLVMLENNIRSGNAKADIMGISNYLEAHLALCRLERLAWEGIAFMGKERAGAEDYRKVGSSYYRGILAYVETGRRYLNENTGDSGISMPPFPQRSVFMAGRHRECKDNRQGNVWETEQEMEGA